MDKCCATFVRRATLGNLHPVWCVKYGSQRQISFISIPKICVVFFFFFFGLLVCLQGDASVPNRWPTFYTRTILLTLKGPSTCITCLWILQKKILLYINSCYDKDICGCGKCLKWNWLIFNYRWLLRTQLLYSWLLFFFSSAFNWSWNSMTYFV